MFKVIRCSEVEHTVAICTELAEAEALMKDLNGTPDGSRRGMANEGPWYRLSGMDETDVSSVLFALAKWMPGAIRKI